MLTYLRVYVSTCLPMCVDRVPPEYGDVSLARLAELMGVFVVPDGDAGRPPCES